MLEVVFCTFTPYKERRKIMRLYLFRNEDKWALQHLSELESKKEKAWDRFIESLYGVYRWAFDEDIRIVSHRLEDIRREILRKVGGHPTISVDPCITGDVNLGVSRVFLPGGKIEMGIRERPGFPAIEQQIQMIPKGEYVLIEDDIFSGGTIQKIIDLLINKEITIRKVVVGIRVGQPQLNVPTESIHNYNPEEVIDLNDPRDFLAGSYGGGLVVRYPQSRVRVPYILPFVDTAARSSIPRKRVLEFSKKIWELNLDFYKQFPKVSIMDVEKYFGTMASRWGFSGETAMSSFCEEMLDLLVIPPMSFGCSARNGVIWIDLNGTLITEDSGLLTVDGEELRAMVLEAKECGWQIGLCSDSPARPLMHWGEKYGIDGPVIAENGALLLVYPQKASLVKEECNVGSIRRIVEEWAQIHSVPLLPDVVSPEFQESHDTRTDTGVAFGGERIASVSVFCLKGGAPDDTLATLLHGYLKEYVNADLINFSEKHGFIAVHGSNPVYAKGEILRWLGWELYKEGKYCWMIGNSRNDLTYAPVLCPTGLVQHVFSEDIPAEQIATSSCTQGVIELIRSIIYRHHE